MKFIYLYYVNLVTNVVKFLKHHFLKFHFAFPVIPGSKIAVCCVVEISDPIFKKLYVAG